jgi:hypothetical protein
LDLQTAAWIRRDGYKNGGFSGANSPGWVAADKVGRRREDSKTKTEGTETETSKRREEKGGGSEGEGVISK